MKIKERLHDGVGLYGCLEVRVRAVTTGVVTCLRRPKDATEGRGTHTRKKTKGGQYGIEMRKNEQTA